LGQAPTGFFYFGVIWLHMAVHGMYCGNMTNLLDDSRAGPDEPEIAAFMAAGAGFYPDNATRLTLDEQRKCYDRLCAHFHCGRPGGMTVADMSCPGQAGDVRMRQFVPKGFGSPGPAMIYMHGGGYILGSLDSHDDICCGIAEDAGVMVIAVDYRLAPEHVFPAAFDDCADATNWVFANAGALGIDAECIVVGGDSAGGNLAAAVCLSRRDKGEPMPSGQVLIYPALGGDKTKGSYVSRRHAPGLTTADMEYYDLAYTGPDGDAAHDAKYRAPLLEANFSGLPQAFLVACEWDPLRDDSLDYARALKSAGVAAQVRHEPELVHACLRARHMSPAAKAMFAAIAQQVSEFAA
jgi:acetyl esterase